MTRTSTRVCTWSEPTRWISPVSMNAEQQALHARGRLADLVHEHRAAIRQLEDARAIAIRAGEAAAHVTEQLGLEQRLGQRGAVDVMSCARRRGLPS